MNRFKMALVFMSALSALVATSSVFACSPPPAYMLKAVTVEESKLPLALPTVNPGHPPTGGCPYLEWPFLFNALTDAEIAHYLGTGTPSPAPAPLPAWSASTVYLAGDSVSYSGKNYRARWWTQNEVPSAASSVWEEIVDAAGNPASWSASVAYAAGAQVTYQSSIYRAKWWSQGEVPGTQWSAWEKIGVAAGKRPAMFHASANFNGSDANNSPLMKVDWSTDMFIGGDNPLADNWKVRINGIVVQQSTTIVTRVGDCAPGSNPCQAAYVQSGSFTIPTTNKSDQITFWLCAGDSCRMTPRLNWYASSGSSVGQEPPF